jgi:hypothetical protein
MWGICAANSHGQTSLSIPFIHAQVSLQSAGVDGHDIGLDEPLADVAGERLGDWGRAQLSDAVGSRGLECQHQGALMQGHKL